MTPEDMYLYFIKKEFPFLMFEVSVLVRLIFNDENPVSSGRTSMRSTVASKKSKYCSTLGYSVLNRVSLAENINVSQNLQSAFKFERRLYSQLLTTLGRSC